MDTAERLESVLRGDESVVADAVLPDARLAVTDHRLAVVTEYRTALDLPLEKLRRIEFDLERGRPATFVIVPEAASAEPQALAIPREAIQTVAAAMGIVGRRIARGSGPR